MFGCFGWGLCASTAGIMFSINPDIVFWMGSGAAVLLMLLLLIAKPQENRNAVVVNALGANARQFSLKQVGELFRMRALWLFIFYIIGVACVYDVFDQQFANFFKTFFTSPQHGTEVFGFVTTAGALANALIMFCSPWIINRIGAKNTLLVAGTIMSVRIIGSAFATSAAEVIVLKMLHALEVPFLLVGAFKYITAIFDTRFSASIYLIGFCFSKQLAAIFLSAFAGSMYDRIGFSDTYFILGGIALSVTVISAFTLSSRPKSLPDTDALPGRAAS